MTGSDFSEELATSVAGQAIFRRSLTRADGRSLHLYGYAPHELPILPQDLAPVATGGQLRLHPLRGEWNIYAAHRQNRTFKPGASADPLAPGKAGGPTTEIPFEDFELAVFDNRFPGLHLLARKPAALGAVEQQAATGKCEVIVYSPAAQGNLHSLGQSRRRLLIAAWIDRYAALFKAGCSYVLPFENRGDVVGVTLHHPHGQIYGFSRVPKVQQQAAAVFAGGYDLAAEIKAAQPDFGIAEMGGMAAFCPRFARFPYEVWIAPREPQQGLWESSEEQCAAFAALLGDITRRYDTFFGEPTPTMFALHCAPAGGSAGYHWTAQFYPLLRAPGRVKYLASVEQHTGVFTVDVMPEAACADLRAV